MIGYTLLPIAWWRYHRGDDRWALALLVLGAFLLRLGPSLDPCLHEWDERYHGLVSKHLLVHPFKTTIYDDPVLPYNNDAWPQAHVWMYKPPMSLWSIALSLKCFGLKAWAVRVPSVLLSSAGVLLLYSLTLLIATRRTAFWAAFLFAIQGHLIDLASGRTSNDHPDTFLMVFVLAAIYAAVRVCRSDPLRWAMVSGVLCGLAFLSKAWPALIVLPVTWFFHRRTSAMPRTGTFRSMSVILMTGAAVALPWSLHSALAFPEETMVASNAHWQHFTVDIEGHGRPWTYYFTQLPMIHGVLAPIVLIWFLIGPFRSDPRAHAALLVWWLLPNLIFSLAVTKMPGYTVVAVPALCIIIALAIDHWSCVPHGDRWRIPGLIGAVGLVLMPVHFSLDRTRPWQKETPRYAIPDMLIEASPRTVVINCPIPIEVMFHTPVAAAYEGPLTDQADRLSRNGYSVLDWKQIPR